MKKVINYPRIEARHAVILTRVSSKEQEEGYSIDAQKHRLLMYCEKKNLDVIRVFEITESSTTGDRRKFLEMIKFAKSQKQPIAIVADKIDRVQRSLREFHLLDPLIQEGKIELHFNTENYIIHKDSVSHERLMWSIGIIMAQSYTDSLRDNVKRSIDHKLRLGEYSSMAPVGYLNVRNDKDKSDIIVDEARAMLVKRIFTEFATGLYTLKHITKMAKQWGLRSKAKSGEPLTRSHIHRIFHNPFYYGVMQMKGRLYPHRYPPLIDKRTYDQCQEVLRQRKVQPSRYGNTEFAFRGLIRCMHSGKTVYNYTRKKSYQNGNTGAWTYLRCWDGEGNPVHVREEKVLEQAETALKALKLPPEVMTVTKQYILKTGHLELDFLRRQTEELNKEKMRLNTRITSLLEMLMDGAINRQEYDDRKAQYSTRIIEIENLLTANRKGDEGFKDMILFILDWCNQAEDLFKGSTAEVKRRIVNSVFSNLTLDCATLCISYKDPFSLFINAVKNGEWCTVVDVIRTSIELRQALYDFVQSQSNSTDAPVHGL